jgi:hypothetical protein
VRKRLKFEEKKEGLRMNEDGKQTTDKKQWEYLTSTRWAKKKLKTAVDEHVTITHAEIAFYKAS